MYIIYLVTLSCVHLRFWLECFVNEDINFRLTFMVYNFFIIRGTNSEF